MPINATLAEFQLVIVKTPYVGKPAGFNTGAGNVICHLNWFVASSAGSNVAVAGYNDHVTGNGAWVVIGVVVIVTVCANIAIAASAVSAAPVNVQPCVKSGVMVANAGGATGFLTTDEPVIATVPALTPAGNVIDQL